METYFERLTNELLKRNDFLTYHQARTWVELLWEDFETSRARAGEEYLGQSVTEQVVLQFISNYGDQLHEFIASNPKYKDLLNSKDHLVH